MTQGKCTRCKIRYVWKDHTQRLCDSVCIYCGNELLMTSRWLGRGINGQVYEHLYMTPKIRHRHEVSIA